MTSDIEHHLTPEKKELFYKRRELNTLQIQLTEKELELTSFQAELYFFEKDYHFYVSRHYIELDEIKAQIAETLSLLNPDDAFLQLQAQIARTKANKSKGEAKNNRFSQKKDSVSEPSNELKKLYRKVVRMIHPDLTTDEVEKLLRNKLLIEINNAYERGDELHIFQILEQIINNGEILSTKDRETDTATQLTNVLRQITQVKKRLQTIDKKLAKLKTSPIYQIKQQVVEYKYKGEDLLLEMEAQIDRELDQAKQELKELLKQL